MSALQVCCMVMKINLDCNACCRKMRRVILRMKEIETHVIEKQHLRVIVCGRFIPADVAIKIRKKMNRRVEIMEIQELSNAPNEHGHGDQPQGPDHGMPGSQSHFPEHHQAMGPPDGGHAIPNPQYPHFPEHHSGMAPPDGGGHGIPMPQYPHYSEHHPGMAQPDGSHGMSMPQYSHFAEHHHPVAQPA